MQYKAHNLRRVARPTGHDDRLPMTGFTVGTPIKTTNGICAVEELRAGDALLSGQRSEILRGITYQNISLRAQPSLAPIYLPKGAITAGLPAKPLYLDPMQLITLRHDMFESCFDSQDVLVVACDFLELYGVRPISGLGDVSYIYLTFDRPTLILAGSLKALISRQDETPPLPIVTGADLQLALTILKNQVRREERQGFPLH